MGDAQMRAAFDFSGLGGPLHQRRPRSETSVTHLRELWVVRKIEEDGVGSAHHVQASPAGGQLPS